MFNMLVVVVGLFWMWECKFDGKDLNFGVVCVGVGMMCFEVIWGEL